MEHLVDLVEEWAIDKGLDKAESSKQMLKVVEEVGEVAAALARGNRDDLKDGIGDVIVTLIILAMQNNTDVVECLDLAYAEIRDRNGKMVDGVFVKSEDLEKTETCKVCSGSGEIVNDMPYDTWFEMCKNCAGKGEVNLKNE